MLSISAVAKLPSRRDWQRKLVHLCTKILAKVLF